AFPQSDPPAPHRSCLSLPTRRSSDLRVALQVGAAIVKLHEPDDRRDNVPAPYDTLDEDAADRTARVVHSAGRTMVLFSGGVKNRSEEHTSELQSRFDLVCRLLLEKKE